MKTNPIITVVLIIVAAGTAFFGGIKYQQSKTASTRQAFNGQFRNRLGANGGQVVGDIISQDDKSVTVKLADGSTKIVLLPSNLTINKATEATKSDIKTGDKVRIFGITNSDGSVTAQNVQLNPIVPNQNPNSNNQ